MKLIVNGKTRIVFLIGKYAVKVARVQPIECVVHLFRLFQKEGLDGDFRRTWLRCFVWGFWANRAELLLYKKHGDALLAPTLFSLFGLINIQLRGEPVNSKEISQHQLQNLLKDTSLAKEFLRSEQFGSVGGRVCLIDYGTPELGKFLP